MGGVIPTITAELAAVSRTLPGVGCKYFFCLLRPRSSVKPVAHVYGAFNLVFGIGTAGENDLSRILTISELSCVVGPIVGGQVWGFLIL